MFPTDGKITFTGTKIHKAGIIEIFLVLVFIDFNTIDYSRAGVAAQTGSKGGRLCA